MTMWHAQESGEGKPLVLLHGIGMSHRAWRAVQPRLAEQRRVIAFDIAGFGRSPALSETTADTLCQALAENLLARGIDEPVPLVGNSMGGWLALSAATRGIASSVVAISPAGLAPKGDIPWYIPHFFAGARLLAGPMASVSKQLMHNALIRRLSLGLGLTSQAHLIPADHASDIIDDYQQATGFDATYQAIDQVPGLADLSLPLTVVFGSRDWLITPSMQRREVLPAHTNWLQPWGWGHTPMWDDPATVAALILANSH